MPFRAIATLVKLAVASLIVGTVLDHFDISAVEILAQLGLTPETALARVRAGFDWALPTLALGAIVIIPVWLLAAVLRPPRAERD
jgi:hypothetical protein